ncbi:MULTISPECIES: GntR family transcriptional regulator [Lactobacillus]|uniref:GntR family transcriptional regulator n=1 Tax=Lactobacillus xujianguonis TaxID=2495899 RepID=A0A437SUL7_9LACO|nr:MULTISPECIES: GntR family transcriptional regulator [Lactobacillus]RVU70633.1 GntR family transcriptional regulator [Lactobacillus xujianguonis]RVU73830.1 GntR family transcriptional regulator [Lactobacillus xujianguonis]
MVKAKYLEIAKAIEAKIMDGTFKKGNPLPDQQTLAKQFNVSRLTVKKALDGLDRKGLIYKQSGLGTFVLGEIPIKEGIDAPANAFIGLRNQMGKEQVSSKVILFSIEFPNEKIQEYLDLKRSEPVYNIRRLRLYNNEPLTLEHTYMPVKLVPDLDQDILLDSIYDYIHEKLNLQFGHAYRRISAVKADEYDEKYLDAKKDDPILELQQIVWLTNGQPIEYSTSKNRYDRRSYITVENNRF